MAHQINWDNCKKVRIIVFILAFIVIVLICLAIFCIIGFISEIQKESPSQPITYDEFCQSETENLNGGFYTYHFLNITKTNNIINCFYNSTSEILKANQIEWVEFTQDQFKEASAEIFCKKQIYKNKSIEFRTAKSDNFTLDISSSYPISSDGNYAICINNDKDIVFKCEEEFELEKGNYDDETPTFGCYFCKKEIAEKFYTEGRWNGNKIQCIRNNAEEDRKWILSCQSSCKQDETHSCACMVALGMDNFIEKDGAWVSE